MLQRYAKKMKLSPSQLAVIQSIKKWTILRYSADSVMRSFNRPWNKLPPMISKNNVSVTVCCMPRQHHALAHPAHRPPSALITIIRFHHHAVTGCLLNGLAHRLLPL